MTTTNMTNNQTEGGDVFMYPSAFKVIKNYEKIGKTTPKLT